MTLALAIVGAVLGVFNTALAAVQWRQSGPRVSVELRAGRQVTGGGIISFEVSGFTEQPVPEDGARPLVVVAVTNSGRSPVDVSLVSVDIGPAHLWPASRPDEGATKAAIAVGIELGDVEALLANILVAAHNEPLPFRLNGDSNKSWVVGRDQIEWALQGFSDDVDRTISATVQLGNGRTVEAKQRVQPRDIGLA